MEKIDYLKVVDIIMKICKSEGKPIVTAKHDKTDIYEVSFLDGDGVHCECKIIFTTLDVGVAVPKNYFKSYNEFRTWSQKFEFEMEQSFLSNFVVKYSEDASNYRMNASF